MRYHSREPGRCRTRTLTPATPASQARTAPVLLDFQLRPPLTRGASAQLTTRTLTQTGDNSLVGAINWGAGALPPEDSGAPVDEYYRSYYR